ncbi:restriction endonuclease [Paenibacillus flagellatus]|uniref:Restriction endonuclease n=2 Tax=Paenibacillus flagellatus TaxID=2211139 RepID=A0A2V5KER1_9BACL|nr:restriction endonuclease [Paenibacillus flagellatus]
MGPDPRTAPEELTSGDAPATKRCSRCGESKPLTDFLRRTGRRSGKASRRGACRQCRKLQKADSSAIPIEPPMAERVPEEDDALPLPKKRTKKPLPEPPPRPEGPEASVLRPTREGIIRMRGRTDKGRRWYQETDLETAVTLVLEHAAVVVNRHTIRRIYTNKKFRQYILMRDNYTCHFCGEYGDTIDHLLPRAKGGHTTPVNCVCACHLCNQSKADRSLDDFVSDFDD